MKLVPAGGVTNQTRLNAAILSLMEADVAHVNYYLVRDRDYLTDDQISKYDTHASGRIRVLKRNQIENYLLVPEAIVSVLDRIFNVEMTTGECEDALRRAAESVSAEVAVGLAGAEVATRWQPEEVFPSRFLRGKSVIGTGSDVEANRETLESALAERMTVLTNEVSSQLSEKEVRSIAVEAIATAKEWLTTDDWKDRYPGRRILDVFASQNQLGSPIVLTNTIIRELGSKQSLIDDELKAILNDAAGGAEKLPG